MKALLLLLSFVSLSTSAATEMGKKFSTQKLTPISKLLADADQFNGKEVTIKGMITNVCSMRGCWMEFASDKAYQTLRIKVRDGDMVFPLSAKGKLAYAKGTLSSKTYSKEQLIAMKENYAKKQNKKADLSKITGPKTYYQFSPVGVRIE